MSDTLEEALALERNLLPRERWSEACDEARKFAEASEGEGVPTGIAYSEKRGWCVIESGQGPYIAWCER